MTLAMSFTVSPEAEAHFREVLRFIAECVPETADLVPALCRGRSWTTWAWRGASAIPEYSDEEYSVRYYHPRQVADWPRVRVAGTDLAADPEALAKMLGLHLVLTGATEGEPLSGQVVARRLSIDGRVCVVIQFEQLDLGPQPANVEPGPVHRAQAGPGRAVTLTEAVRLAEQAYAASDMGVFAVQEFDFGWVMVLQG